MSHSYNSLLPVSTQVVVLGLGGRRLYVYTTFHWAGQLGKKMLHLCKAAASKQNSVAVLLQYMNSQRLLSELT